MDLCSQISRNIVNFDASENLTVEVEPVKCEIQMVNHKQCYLLLIQAEPIRFLTFHDIWKVWNELQIKGVQFITLTGHNF